MADLYIDEDEGLSEEELRQILQEEEKKCFLLVFLNMTEGRGMKEEGSIN